MKKIPSPRVTAQKILTNFMGFQPRVRLTAKRSPLEEDIVIVMDGSGSVGECEFKQGRKALTQAIEMCEVKRNGNGMKPSCQQAAVTFSSGAKRNFNFLPPAQANQKFSSISYPGGGTNTQAGLAEAYKLFTERGTGG